MRNTGIQRVRVRVEGWVQGVSYRASARARASALGLSGWVRNTTDGAVELEAQGSHEALSALIDWCGQGPPAAHVDRVDVEWLTPGEEPEGFRILR